MRKNRLKLLFLVLLVSFSLTACSTMMTNLNEEMSGYKNDFLILLKNPEFVTLTQSYTRTVKNLKEAKELVNNIALEKCIIHENCLTCQFIDLDGKETDDFLILYGGKVYGHKNGFVLNTIGMSCSYSIVSNPKENNIAMLMKYIAYNKFTKQIAHIQIRHRKSIPVYCNAHNVCSEISGSKLKESTSSFVQIYELDDSAVNQLNNLNFSENTDLKRKLYTAGYLTLQQFKKGLEVSVPEINTFVDEPINYKLNLREGKELGSVKEVKNFLIDFMNRR